MRIETKTNADVVGLTIKRNKQHDGQECYVDLEVGVDQQEAESRFGAEFESLAFATMRVRDDGDENKVEFLQDSIKPGSRVVFEKHVISIGGHIVKAQPQLLNIRTIDGAPRVVAKLRIPVDVGTALVSELTELVADVVKVEFNPEQQVLPLKQRPEVVV